MNDFLTYSLRTEFQPRNNKRVSFCTGRDPRIHTQTVVSCIRSPYAVDLDEYKEELACNMLLAWKLAMENIERAQAAQKRAYDRKSTEVNLFVGERVMVVLMPSDSTGKNWKLARRYHGPYRVLQVTPTNAEVHLIDQPKSDSIFVVLERVRRCYPEQGDETWTGRRKHRQKLSGVSSRATESTGGVVSPSTSGPVTRSRSRLNKQ